MEEKSQITDESHIRLEILKSCIARGHLSILSEYRDNHDDSYMPLWIPDGLFGKIEALTEFVLHGSKDPM